MEPPLTSFCVKFNINSIRVIYLILEIEIIFKLFYFFYHVSSSIQRWIAFSIWKFWLRIIYNKNSIYLPNQFNQFLFDIIMFLWEGENGKKKECASLRKYDFAYQFSVDLKKKSCNFFPFFEQIISRQNYSFETKDILTIGQKSNH